MVGSARGMPLSTHGYNALQLSCGRREHITSSPMLCYGSHVKAVKALRSHRQASVSHIPVWLKGGEDESEEGGFIVLALYVLRP